MLKSQKAIKYLALVFAFGLILAIFSSLIAGIYSIISIFTDDSVNTFEEVLISDKITNLDIDLGLTNLEIKSGDTFKMTNDSDDVYYKIDGSTLVIKEKKRLFKNKKINKVIIYINDKTFNDVNINIDAGKHNIENLRSNNFSLDLGAGKTVLNNISINSLTEIETDAGTLNINDSILNNLSLKLDAGSSNINAILKGSNGIDLGAGKLVLNLLDSLDNYTIKLTEDVGRITLNGEKVTNSTYSNGPSYIEVEGGAGSIEIKTLN